MKRVEISGDYVLKHGERYEWEFEIWGLPLNPDWRYELTNKIYEELQKYELTDITVFSRDAGLLNIQATYTGHSITAIVIAIAIAVTAVSLAVILGGQKIYKIEEAMIPLSRNVIIALALALGVIWLIKS